MKPENYVNHSGGAKGADLEWDKIGREFGVTNHIHWRPKDLLDLSLDMVEQVLADVKAAATVLKRPYSFNGIELVQRNCLQVYNTDAIFAISYIIHPGDIDFKGFKNNTGKEIVAGGTGWAVEMAIQKEKLVYVFDMNHNQWFRWFTEGFVAKSTPTLTEKFAGIGSRLLTLEGSDAIRNVYKKTFNL